MTIEGSRARRVRGPFQRATAAVEFNVYVADGVVLM